MAENAFRLLKESHMRWLRSPRADRVACPRCHSIQPDEALLAVSGPVAQAHSDQIADSQLASDGRSCASAKSTGPVESESFRRPSLRRPMYCGNRSTAAGLPCTEFLRAEFYRSPFPIRS